MLLSPPVYTGRTDYTQYALSALGYAVLSEGLGGLVRGTISTGVCASGTDVLVNFGSGLVARNVGTVGSQHCKCGGSQSERSGFDDQPANVDDSRGAASPDDDLKNLSGSANVLGGSNGARVGTNIPIIGVGVKSDSAPSSGSDCAGSGEPATADIGKERLRDHVVGKNFERNRKKKNARKAKKQSKEEENSRNDAQDNSLRLSLEAKWKVQNELAAEEARRRLQVLRASDIQDEVRRRATQVKRHTESNMVAIEKTHKFLSATGNVAGEPAGGQGFAETIIGDSISPDSSASMQEFRAAQKKILDQEQEIEKLKKAYRKAGGNPEAIDLYDKSLFTMEDGTIAQCYVDQFEDLKLSWGFPENAVEYKNGKKKTRIDFYGVKDDDDFNNFYGDC